MTDAWVNPFAQSGDDEWVNPYSKAPAPAESEDDTSSLWGQIKAGWAEYRARGAVKDAIRAEELRTDPNAGLEHGPLGGIPRQARRMADPEGFDAEQTGKLAAGFERAQDLIDEASQHRMSPSVARMMEADTFGEAWEAFTEAPMDAISEIVARSAPGMLESLATGAVGGLVGGPAGFAAGLGLGSGKVEHAASIMQSLQEAGVDFRDPEAVQAALADPELMGQVRDKAAIRAGVIGIMDAATGGLASKTLAPRAISSQIARQAVNIPAQSAVQAAGGAGGEALAQAATGEELRPGEILAEAAGELVSAPVDVAGAILSRKSPVNRPADPIEAAKAQYGLDDVTVVDEPPSAPTAPPAPNAGDIRVVKTARGTAVEVVNEVVEADTLITSDLDQFPGELQPRDRSRRASDNQVRDIAANLDPERLAPVVDADRGAPIIGPDGVVESGNGRVMAIRMAYSQGMDGAQRYRDWIESQGIDTDGMRNPVLVQRRVTDMDTDQRAQFAREANESATGARSATETAEWDAQHLDYGLLSAYTGGDLLAATNRDFVRMFLAKLPAAEVNELVDAKGELSQQGVRRLQAALMAKAYGGVEGGADTIARTMEATDDKVRSITGGLMDAAPFYAAMREDVANGVLPAEYDLSADLMQALNLVRNARLSKQNINDVIGQGSLLNESASPMVEQLVRAFYNESDGKLTSPAGRKRIATALANYSEMAQQQRTNEGQLFDTDPVPPLTLLDEAIVRSGSSVAAAKADNYRPDGTYRDDSGTRHDLQGIQAHRSDSAVKKAWAPGANYVPLINDEALPRTTPNVKNPIRRSDVLIPLLKALEIPLFEKRMGRRKALGYYRPGKETVRIKNPNDLEVTAHELAHLLDDRVPEIRKAYRAKEHREEMRGVSYDEGDLSEGFAEFQRLYMTQPDEARARAPKFTAWYEGFLTRNPKIGKAIREGAEGMQAWQAQDALSRMASKIGPEKSKNEALTGLMQNFRQSVTDDLQGIKDAQKAVRGEVDSFGPYQLARETRAAASIVDGAFRYGAPEVQEDGSTRYVGQGLEETFKPVANDMDKFMLYAVARSADELRKQGRENLFTKGEIKAGLELETPAFKKAFEDYQRWNKKVVQFAIDKNLLGKEQVALWNRTQYIPFYRAGGDPQTRRAGGIEGNWKGIKRLTGGTDNLNDVLGNIIQNARMLITESLKNEARLELVKMLDNSKITGHFIEKIPKDSKRVAVDKQQIERFVVKMLGLDYKAYKAGMLPPDMMETVAQLSSNFSDEPNFINFFIHGQAPKGDNVVAVMKKGKPEFYEVADPILLRSIEALNRPAKGALLRVLSLPRRIGQMTVTLSGTFMARNIARDTIMGAIFSKHGFRPVLDSLRGMRSRMLADEKYRDYIANGGGFASFLVDEDNFKTHMERYHVNDGRKLLHTPGRMFLALEEIADAFEMSTRLGEYARGIEQGVNPREAAFSGREVSADFGMRGDNQYIGFLYDTVMFLKAGVNGLDRGFRGFTEEKDTPKILAKTAMLGMGAMALYAVNRGNPEYEELEDWDKWANFHFYLPKPDGTTVHFTYPKMWEVGAIASAAERTMEQLMDAAEGEGDAAEYAKDVLSIFGKMFHLSNTPFGPMPQAVAPWVEQAANKNFFTDRPIETQGMQNLEPWARAGPGTSRAMAKLGEMTRDNPRWAQIPPARAEALLRGYFNSWATMGLALLDGAADKTSPTKPIDTYPVVRAFYREGPVKNNRHTTQFYELLREAVETQRTMRHMDKMGRRDIGDELEQKPGTTFYKQITRANEHVQAITREINQIYADPFIPPEQKRRQLDALYEERREYMESVVKEIEAQQRDQ